MTEHNFQIGQNSSKVQEPEFEVKFTRPLQRFYGKSFFFLNFVDLDYSFHMTIDKNITNFETDKFT
jgi:hypothetical protein